MRCEVGRELGLRGPERPARLRHPLLGLLRLLRLRLGLRLRRLRDRQRYGLGLRLRLELGLELRVGWKLRLRISVWGLLQGGERGGGLGDLRRSRLRRG